MGKTKEEAHKYLVDKGCLSVGQTYTAFQVERMLTEFATDQIKSLEGEVNERDRRYDKAMKQWDDERDVFKNQWLSLQSQLESLQKENERLKGLTKEK